MNPENVTSKGLTRLLRVACVFALAAIALMTWSIFDPRPLQVILAMSIGQVLGTLSFAMFLFVVLADLLKARRALDKRRRAVDDRDAPPIET